MNDVITLSRRHLRRNGKYMKAWFYELPAQLVKKESKEQAIEFCHDRQLVYAIIDGTPRAVEPKQVEALQRCTTSYVREDGLRFSFGRQQPDKTGGINYKHLLSAVLDGDERAIAFAHVAKNQEWKNIRTTRRV